MDLRKTKIMQEKIFIRTNRRGYIPNIRMQGPIVTPIPVTREVAHDMLVMGMDVHQIDPVTKKATPLTLQSVYPGEGDSEPVQPKQQPDKVKLTNSNPVKPVQLNGVLNTGDNNEEDEMDEDNTEAAGVATQEETAPEPGDLAPETTPKKQKKNKRRR